MSVTRDILLSYVRPRSVMRRHLAAGKNESRALAFLLVGCIIVFVAQWPLLSRQAYLDPSTPLQARMGATLMAWVVIAPLLFYALALILHGIVRLLGGTGAAWTARLALFWAFLACSPLFLLNGLVAGFIGPGSAQTVAGVLLLAGFLYIWAGSMREAGWPEAKPEEGDQ